MSKTVLFQTRMVMGAMAKRRYSAFPDAPASLELHQIVLYHIQDTHWVGASYPSAEMQSVCSTALADRTTFVEGVCREE